MFMEDEFKIITAVGEKDPWYVIFFFFSVIPTLYDGKKSGTSFGTVS